MSSRSIAVIPARSGSKRIPDKNIKLFCGIPMIEMTIQKLISMHIFDDVIVSTDSEKIRDLSLGAGAIVPFLRSKKLSDDYTPTVPVIADCVRRIDNLDEIQFVCCVYPCTPLLEVHDIKRGLQKLMSSNANYCYPVLKYAHPTQRRLSSDANGHVTFAEPRHELTRTQDLQDYFHDSGQFYWGRKSAWVQERKMHTDAIVFEIGKTNAIDIDDPDDWYLAEAIYKYKSSKGWKLDETDKNCK